MIAIGSDHGGYDLKMRVIEYLKEKQIPYQDMGCDSKASVDYPSFGPLFCSCGGILHHDVCRCNSGYSTSWPYTT